MLSVITNHRPTMGELMSFKLKGYTKTNYGTVLGLLYTYWKDNYGSGIIRNILYLDSSSSRQDKLVDHNTIVILEEYLQMCMNILKKDPHLNAGATFNRLQYLPDITEVTNNASGKQNIKNISPGLRMEVRKRLNISSIEEFKFLLEGIGINAFIQLLYIFELKTNRLESIF